MWRAIQRSYHSFPSGMKNMSRARPSSRFNPLKVRAGKPKFGIASSNSAASTFFPAVASNKRKPASTCPHNAAKLNTNARACSSGCFR
jgi:hypothetical protein